MWAEKKSREYKQIPGKKAISELWSITEFIQNYKKIEHRLTRRGGHSTKHTRISFRCGKNI